MDTGKVVPPSMITPRAIREAHAGDTEPRHSPRHPGMVGVAAPIISAMPVQNGRSPDIILIFSSCVSCPNSSSVHHRSVRRLAVRWFPNRQKPGHEMWLLFP